jgi:hypothetical protein
MHKQPVVFLPLLCQAVENTIFDRWGSLSRHFEIIVNGLFSSKNCKEVFSILIALSDCRHTVDELSIICCVKKSLIKQKIARLDELGIVHNAGQFYYLQDKLFRYWVKYIFQKRLRNIDCDIRLLKDEFRNEFAQAVDHFQLVSKTDLSLRIVELLQCFDKESFVCQGRRYRLPIFQKIKSITLKGMPIQPFVMIKATTDDGPWLIVFKESSLSDHDIDLFLKEIKNFSQKPQKRIVISLNSLEDPVRLKALQEKMWIWSEGELNMLLNMFNKPYVTK